MLKILKEKSLPVPVLELPGLLRGGGTARRPWAGERGRPEERAEGPHASAHRCGDGGQTHRLSKGSLCIPRHAQTPCEWGECVHAHE